MAAVAVAPPGDVESCDAAGGAGGVAASSPATSAPHTRYSKKAARFAVEEGVAPVCERWFAGEAHDPETCGCAHQLHCVREERPPCPAFQREQCPYGESRCWYPHTIVPAPVVASIAILAELSHAERVLEWACRFGLTGASVVHPGGRSKQRLVCGLCEDVAGIARRLSAKGLLSLAVRRVYLLGSTWHASLGDALTAACGEIDGVYDARLGRDGADTGNTTTKLRVQAFPKTLEAGVVAQLASHGLSTPVEFVPRNAASVAHVVELNGCFYATVQPESAPEGGSKGDDAGRSLPAATSRAYYKLREVVESGALVLPPAAAAGGAWVAMDVGASPGGWTQCLLEQGASRVFAIDRGRMDVEGDRVAHMKMLADEAIATLVDDGHANAVDVYVCDMNMVSGESIEVLRSALPLLKPGASVVVTFKGFEHGKRLAAAERAAAKANLSAVLHGAEVLEVHCLANRSDERTFISSVPMR